MSKPVFIKIDSCHSCPHASHSGAFTPGGAIPLCQHDDFRDRRVKHKYVGRERKPSGEIPAWCPLRKEL